MPVNRLQSHHTAPDPSRASGGRAFVGFDVPLPRAGAKPPEIVRAMLHHIGMTDADIARFSKQNGYDLVDYSVTSMQKYGGFQKASVHVTREHPQGVARVEIPRADYDALRHFINGSPTNAAPGSTARSARAGGEAYAAHRGINTAAQMRARLDARLPAGKTAAPQVASSSRANSVAQTKPVAQMTTTEKLQFAVERAAAHLGPEAAEKLRALVTPENLAIMAGTTAALIAVQGVPVVDVLVDAGIIGMAVYSLGSEAIGVIKDLAGFAAGVVNAKTEADLDNAGQHMARAVSTVGVDAVAALLLHKAGTAIKENMPRTPAMREMVTPEGIRVRVPMEESPARATVAESRAARETGGRRNIETHETSGGHTIEKHVGKSESKLRQRLANEPKRDFVSSFRNEAVANRVQGQFAKQYRTQIDAWLKSGEHRFEGEVTVNEPIGIVVERGKGGAIETSRAWVSIVRDNSPQGWHVNTSFPINPTGSFKW